MRERKPRERLSRRAEELANHESDAAREEFLKNLNRGARLTRVNAFQSADIGLIGEIRVVKIDKEPVKTKLGSISGYRPKWEFRGTRPVEGVIIGAEGAEAVQYLGESGAHIEWEGKAWPIGKIRYKTSQGLLRTCPLFTGSEKVAAAHFRKHGFTAAALEVVTKAD